jgi:hypothetical protein
MSTVNDKKGSILAKQEKRYSVVLLRIDSTLAVCSQKRCLNFYQTFRQITDATRPDESGRIS